MKKYLLAAASLLALTTAAHAEDSVTVNGITLYGVVDIGIAYQTHGTPLSDYFTPGLEYNAYGMKNLNKSLVSAAPSGLSQSKIGIKGVEELIDGWSGIFKLETGFNPTAGQLTDSPRSLVVNNGIPLNQQKSAGDSSRAGQAFNGAAYVGITSSQYGTLTAGRQNSLLLDNMAKYDPMELSNAFSLLGFTGAPAGGGVTQDARLDSSLAYTTRLGPVRASGLYKFGGSGSSANSAWEFGLGADIERFSIDANYTHVKDAINVTSLTAAQFSPSASAVAAGTSLPAASLPGTLSGTISDNTAYSIMAKYNFGAPKVFVGYENITFANPSAGLPAGSPDIGGYLLGVVNNNAYPRNKVFQIAWTGLKYSVTPSFDVTGAYYYLYQNNYSTTAAQAGCHSTIAGTCSGEYNGVSLVADYKLTKRFDVYGGAMWSQTVGGLANGALHNNTIDPMVGMRFWF